MQPVSQLDGPFPHHERPLSAIVDDVVRSARDVVEQRTELAKLQLREGAMLGGLGVAALLVASVFLGILAAGLWVSVLWGVVWLAGDRLGVPETIGLLWALHLAAIVAAGFAIRTRITRTDEEPLA